MAAGPAGLIHRAQLALPSGSLAEVDISGGSPTCHVDPAATNFSLVIPPNAPAGALFPEGVFRFRSQGCADDTLTVAIAFPQPLPQGVQLQKYGPATTGAAPTWFPFGALSQDRLTATYRVQDNGPGDSNTVDTGVIEDPFAPVLMAVAPGATAAIPTLSQWGMALMSLLLAALAWLRLRGAVPRR